MKYEYIGDEEQVAMLRLQVAQSEREYFGNEIALQTEQDIVTAMKLSSEESKIRLQPFEDRVRQSELKSDSLKKRFDTMRKAMLR